MGPRAKAAPKLKAMGHPIGIGQSQEIDSNMALIAFMMCFGSFIQNEDNQPTLHSKNTVDAVKFMAEIYQDRRDRRHLRLERRAVEQQLPLLGHGVDDPQRDLGDAHAGGRSSAGRTRTTSGSGRSRRARTGGSGSST